MLCSIPLFLILKRNRMKRIDKSKLTQAQLCQRRKFAVISGFLAPLRNIVNDGFKSIVRKKRGTVYPMNVAMSQALKHAIVGDWPDYRVDPERIWLSDGGVANVSVTEVLAGRHGIEISYDAGTSRVHSWDDQVLAVAYCPERGAAFTNDRPAIRSDGKVMVPVPSHMRGAELLVYVMCREREGQRYSRSTYLGRFKVVDS